MYDYIKYKWGGSKNIYKHFLESPVIYPSKHSLTAQDGTRGEQGELIGDGLYAHIGLQEVWIPEEALFEIYLKGKWRLAHIINKGDSIYIHAYGQKHLSGYNSRGYIRKLRHPIRLRAHTIAVPLEDFDL